MSKSCQKWQSHWNYLQSTFNKWTVRMSKRTSSGSGCVLDPIGCVTLDNVLASFGAPVSEEQAWALCYVCIQCYLGIDYGERSKVLLVTSLKHVIVHKDGYVHSSTFIPHVQSTSSRGKLLLTIIINYFLLGYLGLA